MAVESVDDGAAAAEVTAPASTGGAGTQAQPEVVQGQTPPVSWKVGDTTYTKPEDMAEAFRKFHGTFTQRSQEFSKLKTDSEAAMELMKFIQEDPELLGEVRRRLQAGQSPQQALRGAQKAIKDDPEFVNVSERLGGVERQLAQERFQAEHQDLEEKDFDAIATYVADNAEWLKKSGISYDQILDVAYNAVFRTKMGPKLLEQGQRMAEEAIVKGKKGAGIGSPSPTASAARPSKPYAKMSPAEQREYAARLFKANAKA
jgi:hypothetical protein